MKKLSLPTWLQIIYCVCCILVVIFMNLYTAFFPSEFSYLCFRLGAGINLCCALNPIGIICGIWQAVQYALNRKNGTPANAKQFAWLILGPVLTTFGWLLSICAFVHHSGGV